MKRIIGLAVMVIILGVAARASSQPALLKETFEYHRERAIFLFPLYLPLVAFKFTFYDFPKAALSMPWQLAKRLWRPQAPKGEVEELIRSLQDPDLLDKEVILNRLRYITGKSFTGGGHPGAASRQEELIRQWNRWWKEQQRDKAQWPQR